ncbi:hypothetical protein PSEHALCIP103_03394 [Pseudoalteromonas haloplanktis]|jgi:hypothetical protein|uniref:Uncharacterized protein n=1 Tax=Pseudoalteromonas haloplanktis TaxID=228 RepID=A0A9W4R3K2_PSEHA|nr:hypothetical protein PSEHALCIP103_03394 [Pseudoalteromonas haloplanktis]
MSILKKHKAGLVYIKILSSYQFLMELVVQLAFLKGLT